MNAYKCEKCGWMIAVKTAAKLIRSKANPLNMKRDPSVYKKANKARWDKYYKDNPNAIDRRVK